MKRKLLLVSFLSLAILFSSSIKSVDAAVINTSKAIDYSNKYAIFPSNNYPFFTAGDCANFVSQTMRAGGYKDNVNWFYNAWFSQSKTWINAHSLHWHIKSHRSAPLVGKWQRSGLWGLPKPIKNSANLTLAGRYVIFYDFESDGIIDHSSFMVANNKKSLDGTGTGDLTNQHTSNRKNTIWHLKEYDETPWDTMIYAYKLA